MLDEIMKDLSSVVGCQRCKTDVPDAARRLDAVKRLGDFYRSQPTPEIEELLIQTYYLNASLQARIQAGHELGYSDAKIMLDL